MEWNKGDYAILDDREIVRITEIVNYDNSEIYLKVVDKYKLEIEVQEWRVRELSLTEQEIVNYFLRMTR